MWRLKTGAPWRDIPPRYGPRQSCYDRFVRWSRDGTWQRLLKVLQANADATHVKAHRSASGARKTAAQAEKRGP